MKKTDSTKEKENMFQAEANPISKAMIFAAGLGTRFKPWTDNHPKALVPVNGKTLLQRNIEYLQHYGIQNVVVNVHHFSKQILEAVEKNKGWGSHIFFSDESEEVLETGGGLLKAKRFLEGNRFISLNVDILTNAPLDAFFQAHHKNSSLITLAVTTRKTSRNLLFNENNRLCGWRNIQTGAEKIAIKQDNLQQRAYSGMAIFEPEVFNYIGLKGKFSLIDLYLSLAPDHLITSFDHSDSKLLDVGKPESLLTAEKLFP
ncbi:MAG: nucleotidyltransferase family protein [Flavisolibacter sp.]